MSILIIISRVKFATNSFNKKTKTSQIVIDWLKFRLLTITHTLFCRNNKIDALNSDYNRKS